MTKIEPKHPLEFWCQDCDEKFVDSEKPESGGFFLEWGHRFMPLTVEYFGPYEPIIFALCPECLKKRKRK
jgi:hypothetical protein